MAVTERAERLDAPPTPEVEATVQALLARPYRMVVRGDPEEGYLAEAPELPGCFTSGDTPAEAVKMRSARCARSASAPVSRPTHHAASALEKSSNRREARPSRSASRRPRAISA